MEKGEERSGAGAAIHFRDDRFVRCWQDVSSEDSSGAHVSLSLSLSCEDVSTQLEALRQEVRTLSLSRHATSPTIIPTIFTEAQFKKYLREQQSWKGYTAPWWSDIAAFPKTSDTFSQFCSVKLPPVDAKEAALQEYLMKQLSNLPQKKSIPPKCTYIDTHSAPLMDSTRKPDVAMLPTTMQKASLYNLAAILSLKRTIDESAAVELAFMMLDLLTSAPHRRKSQSHFPGCIAGSEHAFMRCWHCADTDLLACWSGSHWNGDQLPRMAGGVHHTPGH